MNVYLIVKDGPRRKVSPGETRGLAAGECPHCKHEPFYVAGKGKHISEDDRAYEAQGFCLDCKEFVGTIRAEVDTLFGVDEDERVLYGRCRVY